MRLDLESCKLSALLNVFFSGDYSSIIYQSEIENEPIRTKTVRFGSNGAEPNLNPTSSVRFGSLLNLREKMSPKIQESVLDVFQSKSLVEAQSNKRVLTVEVGKSSRFAALFRRLNYLFRK